MTSTYDIFGEYWNEPWWTEEDEVREKKDILENFSWLIESKYRKVAPTYFPLLAVEFKHLPRFNFEARLKDLERKCHYYAL